jgi:hypothetical protein
MVSCAEALSFCSILNCDVILEENYMVFLYDGDVIELKQNCGDPWGLIREN